MERIDFIKTGLITAAAPTLILADIKTIKRSRDALVISTWNHGMKANEEAMKLLLSKGNALDAVEAGARISESDPSIQSVGFGGRPDRDGNVTLDACIMDSKGNAGSVAYLQDIKHPISVARKIMEETDHVMLAGSGAKIFAISHGFQEENLLTKKSRAAWLKWKNNQGDKVDLDPNDNHDTISLLAQDLDGNLAGACTTSGLAFKIPGRVGDSPIIGAGLYVDNTIGAAGATGRGEEVIKAAGSFLVVELMRQGYSPQDACKKALERTIRQYNGNPEFQIAYIALRKDGKIGAGAIRKGFKYAYISDNNNKLYTVKGIIN
jgi:isoaspartyl peptidase/L-asparaginase-like protein (Ntn-hydrolase superfamily)